MSNKKKIVEVFDNQFNKEKQYNQILNKIENKNSAVRLNIFKYATITFGIFLLIIGFVINNNKPNVSLSPNQVEENGSNSGEIKREIYRTEGVKTEASWAIDVMNPDVIIDSANIVTKVKVLNKEDGVFFKETNPHIPKTPINIEVLGIIKGDKKINLTQMHQSGGEVTITHVIEASSPERVDKMGLRTLSKEDQDRLYMSFQSAGHIDIEIDETYVVALTGNDVEKYHLSANGFSVFKFDKLNNAGELYTNHITGKSINLNNIR